MSSNGLNVESGIVKKMKMKKKKKLPRDTPLPRTSPYRGVTRHRWTGRYEAHLWDKTSWNQSQNKKGRQVYLGAYDDEDAAARAYDLAALKYWGSETLLNFPVSNYEEQLKEMEDQSKEEYIGSLRRKSSGFSRGVSKFRGVARHHQNGRWEARIGRVLGNKYLYLGTYGTEEEAAMAYDLAETMIALVSVLPYPLSNRLSTQTQNPNSHNRFPSSFSFLTSFPNKTIVFGVNPTDSKDPSFFDENGAVNDMEGYLNHLSLEYDSVWDTKPSWCQPWTIALTGVAFIAISWLILNSLLVTSLVSSLIFAWWYIFLYSYPKAYSEMIAERRERVTNGVEDTFGQRKNQ